MKDELIYEITTTSNSVVQNAVIPLATIARRRGCAVSSGSNAILLNKVGYYRVYGTITLTGQATGDATIVVQKNGSNVAGITSTSTITTASTQVRTLPIDGIVRVYCGDGISNLSLVNTGVAITTSNVSLVVEYIG